MRLGHATSFIPLPTGETHWFEQASLRLNEFCPAGAFPVRCTVTEIRDDALACEIDCLFLPESSVSRTLPSILRFRRRRPERTNHFNTVLLIPTGTDCAIGGHAGDATPVARLLARSCDTLILHPNVVNASDINEQPENALYVEGSQICQLLRGTIRLRRVRSNRILVVTEPREEGRWPIDQVINTTNAARATLGINCSRVIVLRMPVTMKMSVSPSGRATGEIFGLEYLLDVLTRERSAYDAVALSTKITPSTDSKEIHLRYFRGESPNPWGGIEAALTHAISTTLDIPSAHAPTLSDLNLRTTPFGVVEPRKAAEVISTSYFFSVLKGLHRAPNIVQDETGFYEPSTLTAEDISCLVVPNGILGIPVLAALAQDITVIVVRENRTMFSNDISRLPFKPGKLWIVDNYLEAAGLMQALAGGVHPSSARRPLPLADVIEL
jgi:hypothetical protein